MARTTTFWLIPLFKKTLTNKKTFLFLILSFVFIINSLFIPTGVNAQGQTVNILNADFETFKTVNIRYKQPANWNISPSHLNMAQSSDSISGYSVKIIPQVTFILTTAELIEIVGGNDYRFGYRAKSESGGQSVCSLAVKTFNSDKATIETLSSQEFVVGNAWTEVSSVFTLDKNVCYIFLELTIKADTVACFVDQAFGYIEEKTVVPPTLNTHTGASLRLNKDSAGIRFSGSVEKKVYDQFKIDYQNVSAGIMLTPAENILSAEDFTVEYLESKKLQYAKIPAEKWNNTATAETDGYYGFYCALINLNPQNILRDFAFRTYFEYTDNGTTKIVYGNFNLNDNVRSVSSVAKIVYENLESYPDEMQEVITYFATYKGE